MKKKGYYKQTADLPKKTLGDVQYLGRRIKRGLFRSSTGKLINADHNGALNIMRKVVGDSYVSRIVNNGHSFCPVRYSNPFVRIV